jgi:hypothetical protein
VFERVIEDGDTPSYPRASLAIANAHGCSSLCGH